MRALFDAPPNQIGSFCGFVADLPDPVSSRSHNGHVFNGIVIALTGLESAGVPDP